MNWNTACKLPRKCAAAQEAPTGSFADLNNRYKELQRENRATPWLLSAENQLNGMASVRKVLESRFPSRDETSYIARI